MLQFLFDTDHLTLYQHQHAPLMLWLAQQLPDSVGICPINIEEAMRGRLAVLARALNGPKHVQAYEQLVLTEVVFRQFPMVAFEANCESRFQQLRAARVGVGSMDLKIASVALTNGLTVLTRNRRDFQRVPGLMSADWST